MDWHLLISGGLAQFESEEWKEGQRAVGREGKRNGVHFRGLCEERSVRRDGGKVIDAAVTISGTSLRRTDVGSFSKKRNKKHERGRDGGGREAERGGRGGMQTLQTRPPVPTFQVVVGLGRRRAAWHEPLVFQIPQTVKRA